MSFQWIFNNAESISINNRPVVASSTSRDGTVRSTSRGGGVWVFTVKLPDGARWTDYRQNIALAQGLDRTTVSTIQINNNGYNDWLFPNQSGLTTAQMTWTQGSKLVTSTTSYALSPGDIFQISGGKVYRVDKVAGSTANWTYTLNRLVLDVTGSGNVLLRPQDISWSVLCVTFPNWTIFARDQVSWDSPFIFVESMV